MRFRQFSTSCCLRDGISEIFNRKAKQLQRNRAVKLLKQPQFEQFRNACADSLIERLLITKQKFTSALIIGSNNGNLAKKLFQIPGYKFEYMVETDLAENKLLFSVVEYDNDILYHVQADEEFLPFDENTFDLVISNNNFHWVNDLRSLFKGVNYTLKADGVFIFTMPSHPSMKELQLSFDECYNDNRAVNIVAPMIDGAVISSHLEQAKFICTTIDFEDAGFEFPSINELIKFLKYNSDTLVMKEQNPVLKKHELDLANNFFLKKYNGIITINTLHAITWKNGPLSTKKAEANQEDMDSIENMLNNT